MARERIELTRKKNFLTQGKIFILSYEGNDTEPQYYEALKERLKYKDVVLHIESLRRNRNDTNSAPKHVFKMLKEKKNEYNFKNSDEFWMIIDRDRWELNEWVEKCNNENNFFIALSNPTFEFWLVLHLFQLGSFSQDELNQMLENKKVSSKRRYLDRFLSDNLEEGYNKSNLNPDRFLDHINLAIEQGELLASSNIMTSLGSHNYKLLKKLTR